MVVGYGTIRLRLYDNHSLKGKRKVVKAIIGRIRSSFNASVAETAENDRLQFAEIGFAVVGNSGPLVNSKLDRIQNLVDDMGLAQIVDSETEIVHL